MRCGECGMGITAEEQKGHIYYRCTKKRRLVALNLCERRSPRCRPIRNTYTLRNAPRLDARVYSSQTRMRKIAPRLRQPLAYGSREQITAFKSKIDRITDLFVEQDIDRETYLAKKRGLMSEKRSAEEILAKSQRGGSPWLEPMREWIKDASTLDEIAKGDDLPPKILPPKKSSART